jgi:ribulose-phosphate 3-epimerase
MKEKETKSKIIPAILPKGKKDLEKKLEALPEEISYFHLDVLEEDIWTDVKKDFGVHLMVKEPEKIIDKWIKRGAKRIIVHLLEEWVEKARERGVKIGLAVELHVPLEDAFPLLSQVDFVHLMSIAEIGAQGRPFEPKIFDRIKKVREKFPNLPISVDGGIDSTNYQSLIEVGADMLVVGSDFKELWNSLKKELRN